MKANFKTCFKQVSAGLLFSALVSAPAAKANALSSALFAEASNLSPQAGETLRVKVLVPIQAARAAKIQDCGGTLSSPELAETQISFDRCSLAIPYPHLAELTLEYRFPNPTVQREYRVQEVFWRASDEKNYETAQVLNSAEIQVQTRMRLPEMSVTDLRWDLGSPDRKTVRAGETVLLHLGLESMRPLTAATLRLKLIGQTENSTLDLSIAPGARPGAWIAGVEKTETGLQISLRIPHSFVPLKRIEASSVILFNEALQETIFQPRSGFGIDVEP